MTDRERALAEAEGLGYTVSIGTVDATPEQRKLQDEVKTRCIRLCDIADALLEAQALGVEWAAKERCARCRSGSKSRNATHDLGQEPSEWLGGERWIDCDAAAEVERAAELRAQKGSGK